MHEKDIRFPDKKVDSAWKEEILKQKDKVISSTSQNETSPVFLNLIRSLAMQAVSSFEDAAHSLPVDPQEALGVLELLKTLQQKTKGHLSGEEEKFLVAVIGEISAKLESLR